MKNVIFYSECIGLTPIDKKYYATELETLRNIRDLGGGLNPVQATRLQELETASSWGHPDGIESPKGSYLTPDPFLQYQKLVSQPQPTSTSTAPAPFDYAAAAKAQADATIAATTEQYAKLAAEYNQRYKDFETANPFNFDDILAQETTKVGERLDPYYKQTLSDYLTGVNMRRNRSLQDERTLLTDLQKDIDQYQGNEKLALDQTLERTRQGYADAGLYFSGAKQRAEGMATADSKRGVDQYLGNQDSRKRDIQTTASRSLQDVELERSQKQRDLGSFDPTTGNYIRGVEPTYQVKAEALSEANRKQQLLAYEKSQFLGAAPGVDYTTYQKNSNNTLLNALS